MNPFSHHHSDDLKDRVRDLYRQGETYRSIGKKVGLTRNAIAGLCSRLGLSSGAQINPVLAKRRDVRDLGIKRMLLAGATVREVADELQVSPETVRQRRRAFGIAPTHHGDRRRVRSTPPVLVVEKVVEPVRAPDPASAVAFTSASGCRYALWATDETDLASKRVCGGDVHRGSYCSHHYRLVYQIGTARKAA